MQSWAAWSGTWFLLLAAPRPVLELQSLRRRGQARTSDADQLARLTRIPGLVWVGVFLAVTVGCLVLGAGWLLGLRLRRGVVSMACASESTTRTSPTPTGRPGSSTG